MMSLTGTPAIAYKRWLQAIWVAPRDSRPRIWEWEFSFYCEAVNLGGTTRGEARPKGMTSLIFLYRR